MNFNTKKWIWLFVIVIVVAGVDQVTKWWAANKLARDTKGFFPPPCDPEGPVEERVKKVSFSHIEVIKGLWDFRYVENCGGAFGFLSNQREKLRRPFFYISNIIAGAFLIYLLIKLREEEKLLLVAFSIILGGAVGNVLDRVRLGYVIDFIDWHIKEKARWPTFNFADAGITIGLILILFDALFLSAEREKKYNKEKSKKKKNI